MFRTLSKEGKHRQLGSRRNSVCCNLSVEERQSDLLSSKDSCQFGVINEICREEGKTNLRRKSVSSSFLYSPVRSRLFTGMLLMYYSVKVCLVGWPMCMQYYAIVALCEEVAVKLRTDHTAIFLCLLFGTSEVLKLVFWSHGTSTSTSTSYPITSSPQFTIIFKTNY
jgi:hypothetical protein